MKKVITIIGALLLFSSCATQQKFKPTDIVRVKSLFTHTDFKIVDTAKHAYGAWDLKTGHYAILKGHNLKLVKP